MRRTTVDGRRRRSNADSAQLPLRPRQYVLRLSITDAYQLASYDVVTAGPRFAVTGQGGGVDSLADEQDGLVIAAVRVRRIARAIGATRR